MPGNAVVVTAKLTNKGLLPTSGEYTVKFALNGKEISYNNLGDIDAACALIDDYKEWERTEAEVSDFMDNNNMTENYQKCCSDDWHLDICFPTVSLSRGKVGSWDAKITNIGWRCVPVWRRGTNSRASTLSMSATDGGWSLRIRWRRRTTTSSPTLLSTRRMRLHNCDAK